MTTIEISVVGAVATSTVNGKITSGMVGIPVTLSFDSAWAGLQKTVVFRAGKFSRDRRNVESSTTVPKEITRLPFRALEIGVEGKSEDGSTVIPTVWTTVTTILPGANATIPASTDPNDTPSTGGGTTTPSTAVLYTKQTLSETQKTQARENIGAASIDDVGGGGVEDAVLYTEQSLTEEQKAQARENIGAVTLEEVIDALPIYNGEVEEV